MSQTVFLHKRRTDRYRVKQCFSGKAGARFVALYGLATAGLPNHIHFKQPTDDVASTMIGSAQRGCTVERILLLVSFGLSHILTVSFLSSSHHFHFSSSTFHDI